MRLGFAFQAALFGLLVPLVLIVPEIPLGRVVTHTLRWSVAAPTAVLASVSAWVAWRGDDAGRSAVVVLALGGSVGLAASLLRGGPQALVLGPLLVASIGLSGWRLRRG